MDVGVDWNGTESASKPISKHHSFQRFLMHIIFASLYIVQVLSYPRLLKIYQRLLFRSYS